MFFKPGNQDHFFIPAPSHIIWVSDEIDGSLYFRMVLAESAFLQMRISVLI